ncbi:MAG: hypothetical protein ACRC7O_18190 [Fimbriiglobus sp.]
MNRYRVRIFLCVFAAGRLVAPAAGAADDVPATVAELRDCIDWPKLPRLPGATDVRHRFKLCSYQAPATLAEAAAFFRKTLPAAGWVEDATAKPGFLHKDLLSVGFIKGSMRLAAIGVRIGPAIGPDGPSIVTLALEGNVDVRRFPRPADAKITKEWTSSVSFTTALTPADAAENYRKTIAASGWQEAPVESAKYFAKNGHVVHRFVKNGLEINVSAHATRDGRTEVRCSTGVRITFEPADVRAALTPKDVPTPATLLESRKVFDHQTFPRLPGAKISGGPSLLIVGSTDLAYSAPGPLADAVRFQRAAFAERGWKETWAGTATPNRVPLAYEKSGYLVSPARKLAMNS